MAKVPKMENMTDISKTQIGADGKRYPIGDPRLRQRPGQLPDDTRLERVDPSEDEGGIFDDVPGVSVTGEVSPAEAERMAAGKRIPEGDADDADDAQGGEGDDDDDDDAQGGEGGGEQDGEFDLETATKAELIEHAEANDIEVHKSYKVDEIREEVREGLNADS